jgi:hypothetical protein
LNVAVIAIVLSAAGAWAARAIWSRKRSRTRAEDDRDGGV